MGKRTAFLIFAIAFSIALTGPRSSAIAAPETTGFTFAGAPVLLYDVCMPPTKANIAFSRAACDEAAEKAGYKHGVFRPVNPNDEVEACPLVEVGQPATEQFVCEGVGGGN